MSQKQLKQYNDLMDNKYSKEDLIIILLNSRRERDNQKNSFSKLKEKHSRLEGRYSELTKNLRLILNNSKK